MLSRSQIYILLTEKRYSASLDICKIGLFLLFIDIIQHTQFNEPFPGPPKFTDRLLVFVCGFKVEECNEPSCEALIFPYGVVLFNIFSTICI